MFTWDNTNCCCESPDRRACFAFRHGATFYVQSLSARQESGDWEEECECRCHDHDDERDFEDAVAQRGPEAK